MNGKAEIDACPQIAASACATIALRFTRDPT
jgi:hypothetical protein